MVSVHDGEVNLSNGSGAEWYEHSTGITDTGRILDDMDKEDILHGA